MPSSATPAAMSQQIGSVKVSMGKLLSSQCSGAWWLRKFWRRKLNCHPTSAILQTTEWNLQRPQHVSGSTAYLPIVKSRHKGQW